MKLRSKVAATVAGTVVAATAAVKFWPSDEQAPTISSAVSDTVQTTPCVVEYPYIVYYWVPFTGEQYRRQQESWRPGKPPVRDGQLIAITCQTREQATQAYNGLISRHGVTNVWIKELCQ